MTWNYRLILRDDLDEDWCQVHEVYYNSEGNPMMYTENPISLEGENLTEIVEELDMILADIKKHPILLKSELPSTNTKEG